MRLSFLAVLVGAVTASCARAPLVEMRSADICDSTMNVRLSVRTVLPEGCGRITQTVRDGLLEALSSEMESLGYLPEGSVTDLSGHQAAVRSLACVALRHLDSLADRDRRTARNASHPYQERRWECGLSLAPERVTDRYAVFLLESGTYLGGAHAGIVRTRSVTFCLRDGIPVREMLREGADEALSEDILEGLAGFYAASDGERPGREELLERLFVSDGTVPLPQGSPTPTEDGLLLRWEPYEIAPYQDGMPCVLLPYGTVAPLLTERGADILGNELKASGVSVFPERRSHRERRVREGDGRR